MTMTVTVRMYNVGFGDAFLVTVTHEGVAWRMLVDCGVHMHGRARPISEVVDAIIADLRAVSTDGSAYLDVLVATHHHADHISGLAEDAWSHVRVGEVWVPFVEDPTDPDAVSLRQAQTTAAKQLVGLLEHRTHGLDPGAWPVAVTTARSFAMNSSGNAKATNRLLGREGVGFATTPNVRYLPSTTELENSLATTLERVTVHVLGPSRDPAQLKRMDPPAGAGWLRLDAPLTDAGSPTTALFNDAFTIPHELVPTELEEARSTLRLGSLDNDEGLLAAASVLERSVNNTSLFFVLDVAGTKLLFPGDAQEGAWDHVLDDPVKRALVADVAFYKIGHHGSHNATPKRFVETILQDGGQAMLPWGLVKAWRDSIPKTELLAALDAHHHHVTRADAPVAVPDVVTVHDDLWSEVTLQVG
jgi:beta-lactamase superfamily II metal-dependent hydrolase